MDYACGYGRVLRWLQAKFPSARLLGVDANARAAASAAAVLGVDTRPLDISLKEELGETFDLIWVGSLFTHLARSEFGHVLSYLVLHLANEGCLVFTTHGDEVAQRIASRVRVYNLQEAAVETLLAEYTSEGHGFGAYKGMADYGISCTKASAAMQLIERAGLLPVFYKERGWNKHQDVFAAKKQ